MNLVVVFIWNQLYVENGAIYVTICLWTDHHVT